MRVADYLITRLVEAGVQHIFGVSGRGSLFLTDAIAKNGSIKYVASHHEQASGFSALGYSQTRNDISVCLVSTGCGSTNAITPVLSAWQDGIPTIFISGQNLLNETTRHTKINLRTYGQQETDIIKLVEPITKYATMIEDPEDIGVALDTALFEAMDKRKGPVWIDIPLDIQSMQVELDMLKRKKINSKPEMLSEEDKDFLIINLKKSTKPIVVIGSGVRSAGVEAQLKEFVEINNLPAVFSASAADSYSTDHKNSIGSFGAMGCSRAGNFAIQHADLLLILGSKLNSMLTGNDFDNFAPNAIKIVVDVDEVEHTKKGVKIDKLINLDLKIFFNEIMNVYQINDNDKWLQKCIEWKNEFMDIDHSFEREDKVDLYELASHFSETLPAQSTLVTDSGLIELIIPSNMQFSNGKKIVHPHSQGAMGYAIPASIGVKFAGEKDVFALVGDGSIMMNIQELQTIRYHKLPIKIFVISNGTYAIIRKRQKELFKGRTIGTDETDGIDSPNFSDVATCFGLKYFKCEKISDLKQVMNEIIESECAILCEILGFEDQDYVQVAPFKDVNGKLIRGRLENMYPFIDQSTIIN